MKQVAQGSAEVQAQADPMPVIGPAITVEFDRAIVRIPDGASPVLGSAALRSLSRDLSSHRRSDMDRSGAHGHAQPDLRLKVWRLVKAIPQPKIW